MKIMSRKLSLVVFLAIVGSIACQDCFTGIKKWAQCSYLSSFMVQVPPKTGVFVQNPFFPFDIITNDFINALNLTVKYPNFTSAMNFFRNTIYSAKNKKNKCFATKFLDQRGKYSTIFSNTNFFNDAVAILSNFSREYPTRLSSPKGTTNEYWNKFGASNLSTLRDFCIKNDFTSNVYDFYSGRDPLCNIVDDEYEENYYSCVYDTIVNKVRRTVTTSPSKAQLTTLAKCSVRPLKGCNKTVTNLFSLFDYTDYWPQLPIPNRRQGMISYFATLLDSPPTSRNFTYAHAQWSATYLSVSSPTEGNIIGGGLWCNSTHADLILNTSNTSITGTWSNCRLTNITIRTQFPNNPDGKKVATRGFSIVNPNVRQTNNKYFKDPTNRKNWLFVRVSKNGTGVNRTQINDLETNVNIIIEPNRIDIFFETSSLSQASGIVIDGFDDEDVMMVGRKRREVSEEDASACKLECSTRKRRWTGPVLDDENSESSGSAAKEGDWHAHVLDYITDRAGCVQECLRR